jgi:predicted Zn-dependent protease
MHRCNTLATACPGPPGRRAACRQRHGAARLATRLLVGLSLAALAPGVLAAEIDPVALMQGGDIAYRRALAPLAAARKLNTDPMTNVRARRIFNRIVTAAPATDAAARTFAWSVDLVADPAPSLVVYPAGRVLLNDGLVAQAGFLDDEIAAILAHMMAHSLLGHDASRIASRAEDALASPDPNRRALAVADAAAALLPAMRYTPTEIEAADREGVALMARVGYDPRAAGSAWRRLRDSKGVVTRAPVTDARLATLDAVAREALPMFEDARARAAAAPAARTPGPGREPSPPR